MNNFRKLIPSVLGMSIFSLVDYGEGSLIEGNKKANVTGWSVALKKIQLRFLKEPVEENNSYFTNYDALTGLPQRRYVTKLLDENLEIAKQSDNVLVLMCIGLNGLEHINDIHGHTIGDEVHTIVAKRLKLAVGKNDCLSRFFGNKYFIGLLMEKENLAEVENMAEKFASIISDPMNVDGSRLKVTTNIGIAAYPTHGNKVSALMYIADKKRYQAKRGYDELKNKRGDFESIVIFPNN